MDAANKISLGGLALAGVAFAAATLFVVFRAGHAAGRIAYHVYVDVSVARPTAPPGAVAETALRPFLLAPEPLRDTLFGAPATAALVTAAVALVSAVRRRAAARPRSPSASRSTSRSTSGSSAG